ncbi:MAG: helix-turn-helix transcriptional regulator [Bacteroidia bacterium]|nr:helix-turn-helix transcriptional regulator [Bacteroidia bacterium]
MKDESRPITNNRHSDLARLCGALSNPSRIALLEKLACDGTCIKNDFIDLEGMSKFTVGMNLKYLKKFELVNGNLSSKKLSYCLNYQKLDELKKQFDEFYERINRNRGNIDANKGNCLNE